ncbi:MAG: HEAT repeat domain-containing protein [Thermoguttaceae bacterium]|nr:HEAT repeat domain-containing protein [Thermoguttaceae bacterium]
MRTTLFTLLTLFSTILFAQEGTFNGKDAAYWTGRLTKTESTENLQNRTRWYAGYALGEIGTPAASAVDALCERLLDVKEYEYTRAVCAWALGRIQDKNAVPALTEALKSKMDAVRICTAQSLGAFGTEAGSAAESLSALLDGKSLDGSEPEPGDAPQSELIEPVKAAVAAALWKVAPTDSPSAQKGKDALLAMLKKNSTLNRIAALSELISLAQDDDKDLSDFYRTMTILLEKSSSDDIARDCGTILMLKKQYDAVHGLLANENDVARRRALRAICLYKEKGIANDYTIPVERVLPLAESEDALIRVWTIRTLGLSMDKLESESDAFKAVESAIVKAVEDENVYVKKAARKALKN